MAVTARIQSISRDLELMMEASLGPKARSAMLAAYAAEAIEDAAQQNKRVLGAVPPYDVYVDGVKDAPLRNVKPEGFIRAEFGFGILNAALLWIHQQLVKHSPVLQDPTQKHSPYKYSTSHLFFADGRETNINKPPLAEEYAFVNTVPYARKIEGLRGKAGMIRRPLSPQAPDGVYQVVAKLAASRFGNIASVRFSYREVIGGERNPAIIVKLGT